MHPSRTLCTALLALLLASCAATPSTTPDIATRWHSLVTAISAGDDTAARGAAIRQRLEALGLSVDAQPFRSGELAGVNLLADLGGPRDAPAVLLGAHYDRVPVGRGATDNASGAAVVLELAAALQARPLPNHRVLLAFWDLEERGLLGAQAWIAAHRQAPPALYVNFNVFGWGDTLLMMTATDSGPLAGETATAAATHGLALHAGADYPPTDHRAFLAAGLPAVSYSLLGGEEIAPLLLAYSGGQPALRPKVVKVIHSARDTIAELDARHVPAALKVVEDALRAWDAR